MATIEATKSIWGPKDVPYDSHNMQDVTGFTGTQLSLVENAILRSLERHPRLTRDRAIRRVNYDRIAHDPTSQERLQTALDIINQLSILNRRPSDVKYVILRRDLKNKVISGSGTEKPRSGEGSPHYFYEIEWSTD